MYKRIKLVKATLSLILIISMVAVHLVPLFPAYAQEVTGATGITSTSGATGPTGDTGSSGPTGASDATGVSGPTGTTGASSNTGPTGSTGSSTDILDASGPTGSTGASATTITIGNQADVTNDATSSAISGDNSASGSADIATPSATPEGTPSAAITTGDAVSVTTADNSVNSTSVNSQITNQTVNIFVPQNSNLNLSTEALVAAILSHGHENDTTVSAVLTGENTFAYLKNSVSSIANTGANSVESASSAAITTGNAASIVSVLNKVNSVFIDSVLHFITINIFSSVAGNILLPETTGETGTCCGTTITLDNNAVVTNTVDSTAVSGQNTIESTASGAITTGTAQSAVNILNIVNQTYINVFVSGLYLNVLGSWDGNFRGWNSLGAAQGGQSLALQSLSPGQTDPNGCLTCFSLINIKNSAEVDNNISSLANTGGNTIEGYSGNINTGSAYSAVSLINLINSSFFHSIGFFGFINIFGSLTGDVGGASLFPTPTPTPVPETTTVSTTQNSNQSGGHDSGGLLDVTQTNNVGAYVFPGDTVTFFMKVKNTGGGHVYNAKVDLILIRNGVNMGGASFPLGDIDPGKGSRITTGIVLSKTAPPGPYVARAIATGTVGPDDHMVSATADSTFLIFGTTAFGTEEVTPTPTPTPTVLGTTVSYPPPEGNVLLALFALLLLLPVYMSWRITQRRELFDFLLNPDISWRIRFRAITMLLL